MRGYSNVVPAILLWELCETTHNAEILSVGCGLGRVQQLVSKKRRTL